MTKPQVTVAKGGSRLLNATLSAVLVVGLMPAVASAPTTAYADNTSVIARESVAADSAAAVNAEATSASASDDTSANTRLLAPLEEGNETPTTSWYSATATEMTVSTYAELAEFAQIVNGTHATISQDSFRGKTVKLAADIDMGGVYDSEAGTWSGTSWTPIGNAKYGVSGSGSAATLTSTGYAFEGTFDGQGHSLTNFYISASTGYLGLFGALGGTDTPGAAGYGVVKNLTIASGYITCTSTSAGGTDFVAAVAGKLNAGATVQDVVNKADVYAPYTMNVGGIVGGGGSLVTFGSAADAYGVYTSNPSGANTYILRCGNEGAVAGYYKDGGIVGENAAIVRYCYNSGTISQGMDGSGGGIGGIAGRNGNNNTATEEGTIEYCYNAGVIKGLSVLGNAGIRRYGGISGWNDIKSVIAHNYDWGQVEEGYSDYQAILGKADASTGVYDNYALDTVNDKYTTAADAYKMGIKKTSAQLKATTYNDGDILTLLSPAFVADSATNPINSGYPVLYWQAGVELATPTALTISTAPTKTSYSAGETFDTTGMVLKATFSDGSTHVVDVADCTYDTSALKASDTAITFSYTYNGTTVTASQAITVISSVLTGISVTTAPSTTVFASDETFDATGMVVTASYNDGAVTVALDASAYTVTEDRANKKVVISYTEGDITVTCEQAVEFLSCAALAPVDGVFQISTADELTWFSVYVNSKGNFSANAKLMADITASSAYMPLGTYANSSNYNPYTGTFDGNGHTVTLNISATTSYVGLVCCLGAGTVKNVTVGGTIATTMYSAGGIAGYVIGGAATIENCVNNASVSAQYYVGGMIANSTSSAAGTVIKGCVNNGTLTSTGTNGYVGGIAGNAYADIQNCTNKADITSPKGYIGGIVGYSYGNISGCVNEGAITAGATYAAGIAGYSSGSATVPASITNCVNKGSITGTGYVVGIVGYSKGVAAAYNSVTNCMNYGNITSTGSVNAGIAGYVTYSSVTNCGNEGNVTTTSATALHYAGGIVCQVAGYGSLSDSYNTGDVTGQSVGGVCAWTTATTSKISNCYNTGDVTGGTGTINGAGGVVGYTNFAVTNAISNCYNTGTVTGYSVRTGAIIGYATKAISFSNCYVLGDSDTVLAGSGCTVAPTLSDCAAKSADELKASDMLTTLGDSFKADGDGVTYVSCNEGYPILAWQTLEKLPTVTLSSEAANLKVGDTFTVALSMTDLTAAMQGTFVWSDSLQLTSVVAGGALAFPEGEDGFEWANDEGADPAIFSFVGNTATEDGVVAVATFTCVKAGEASVSLKDCVASDVADKAGCNLADPEALTFAIGLAGTIGDVNNTGTINIVDAQIVYDLASGKYGDDKVAGLLSCWPEGATLDMVKVFCDVNADDSIDSSDSFAIQYAIHHGGSFGA